MNIAVMNWSVLVVLLSAQSLLAQEVLAPIAIWPATPPGRLAANGEEGDTTTEQSNKIAGMPLIRLGNVSKPTLTIYKPAEEKNSGAAVLICPGGAYRILAYDLEGTEVCQWLNSIGITAGLLKYRVPKADEDPRPIEALQDAQRAMAILRSRSADLAVDDKRIGVLGFSAGGHLSARLSTNYDTRAYEAIDETDRVSCRPDFAVLVYPAYLIHEDAEQELPVDAQTPPMFLTMAADDPVDADNVLQFSLTLKHAKVPVELHLYPSGGHGYGLRRTEAICTHWPDRAEQWMHSQGILQ
ncbi:MAG: alpha/beta hydrolase [Pirellulaceae bacterium]|jgi:acetyl esterase/lipase|nr:alpha/beta hydrolase [Pirellulaceae bacterium]